MSDINSANTDVLNRILAALPVLVGVGRALDVIPGMQPNMVLHAGPPIAWTRMSGPLRGAVVGGLIFEGLANTEVEAAAAIERERCASTPAIIMPPSDRWPVSPRPRCRSMS